jgi:hypothetical protein
MAAVALTTENFGGAGGSRRRAGLLLLDELVYVYGPALSAQSLVGLLLRAGAVEAMELDINPFWTTFEYYQARGHPADPTRWCCCRTSGPPPTATTRPTAATHHGLRTVTTHGRRARHLRRRRHDRHLQVLALYPP